MKTRTGAPHSWALHFLKRKKIANFEQVNPNKTINCPFYYLLPELISFKQENEMQKFMFLSLERPGMPASVVAFDVRDREYKHKTCFFMFFFPK